MNTKQFSRREAVKFGWQTWKANVIFFIAVILTTWIISALPDIIADKNDKSFLTSSLSFATWVLSIIVGIGTTKIALVFAQGNKPDFNELFSNYRLFFKYLFGSILYGLIVFAGLLLFIVPGVIWALKFHFYSYLIVDKGVGPIEALKQSSQLTKGLKGQLLIFGLLLLGINVLGLLVFVVGLFATIPLSMVAMAYVYYKLLNQTSLAVGDSTSVGSSDVPSVTNHD